MAPQPTPAVPTSAIDELLLALTRRAGDDEGEEIFEQLMIRAQSVGPRERHRLLAALSHPEPVVRQAVSAALIDLIDRAAAVPMRLLTCLRDSDPTVRGNVALALGRLTPDSGMDLETVLESLDEALGSEEDDWAGAIMLEAIERLRRAAA